MAGPAYGAAFLAADAAQVVAVGPRGMDYSPDGGRSWTTLDDRTWWAVEFSAGGLGWAVGPQGRIVKLDAAVPPRVRDDPSGTILVANMDDDSVWLIDAATGTRRASLATRIAPHEIAVSHDGRIAAVMNYGDERGPGNLVQFVDVSAGVPLHEVSIEGYERLHGAAFLPGDSLLALTSERTGEILVVSARDGGLRRALPTGGRATHMLALAGRWIYAANIVDGTVSRIDLAGDAPPLVWPAGTRTEGVAATPDGREGWTGSMDGGFVVGVDGATGEVVARIDGLTVPYRLAVTPDGATVVVSDPEGGTLVLIDRARGMMTAAVDVDAAAEQAGLGAVASPQGFVLSPDGDWAFVSANAIAKVAIVHLPSRSVVRFVDAGAAPDGIAFSPVPGR
jgi:YVTN family beta-propeller protein